MVKKSKEDSFQAKMTRLEKIIERLESDDVELEEALAAFEEGVKLSEACAQTLSAAEKKVELLLRKSTGEVVTQPFNPDKEEEADGEAE